MDMDLAATPAYVPAYHPRLALKLALPLLSATTPTHPRAASHPTCQATVKKAEKAKAAGCPLPVITRVLRRSIRCGRRRLCLPRLSHSCMHGISHVSRLSLAVLLLAARCQPLAAAARCPPAARRTLLAAHAARRTLLAAHAAPLRCSGNLPGTAISRAPCGEPPALPRDTPTPPPTPHPTEGGHDRHLQDRE